MSELVLQSRSQLEKALRAGQFVATAEILPSRVPSFDAIDKKLTKLNGSGCAINVTDNASAAVKMCSLAVCARLIQQGREPVFQVTCRDRNRLAAQSDLLGALALGIRNVFCVSGDYITMGDHPMAKPVFDLDSVQLLQIFNRMRTEGLMAAGVPLSDSAKAAPAKPQFFLGAASNPFGDPMPMHLIKMKKKAAAGADFIQTQCIFDIERMKKFMELVRGEGLHEKLFILAGVMPVKSHKGLEFMRDNVPGMRIPESLIERLKGAKEPKDEGIQLAADLIQQLREIPGIAGIHIMTPNWEEAIPQVLERAGLASPPAAAPEKKDG